MRTIGLVPAGVKTAASEEQGAYKGIMMSPSSVKFKTTFQGIPINVDRPKGFIMKGTDAKGNDWARRYKYDYGFIPKTLGGDGDGLDVFIGPDSKASYSYWAMQRDDAGNFDEYKVFLGFPDRDAAVAAYRQHIPKKYFQGIVTMKVEMMKAMLGKVNPDEKMKRASALSMLDELGWIMSTSASPFGLDKEADVKQWLARQSRGIKHAIGRPKVTKVLDPDTGEAMVIPMRRPFQDIGESLEESGRTLKSRPEVSGVHGLPKASGPGLRILGGGLEGAGKSYGAETAINPLGLPLGKGLGGMVAQSAEELSAAGYPRLSRAARKVKVPVELAGETAGVAGLGMLGGIHPALAGAKSVGGTALFEGIRRFVA